MGTASADDLENAEKAGVRTQDRDLGSTADMMAMDDSGHRRSDHDRQWGERKTKIKDEDAMDVDGIAATSRDEGEFSLSSLEKDFGPAFHLCKTCKVSPRRFLRPAHALWFLSLVMNVC